MKTMLTVLIAVLALALGGCSTINSRIKERYPVFASLDAATQDQIRHGQVGVGYSPDMVYMALGRPTYQVNRVNNDGTESTWIYKSYYEEYAGSAFVGYRRYAVLDRTTNRYVIYTEPVYSDLYRERADEYLRVVFKRGKVDSIEQTNSV
jgi:hypothetical protein